MEELFGRRRARAQSLQLLFQAELSQNALPDILAEKTYVLEYKPLDEFAVNLALATFETSSELDELIDELSDNWSIERLPLVDKCLLRQAVAELKQGDKTQVAVVIDETVELAKRYGTDNSYRYVNGILGEFVRRYFSELELTAAALEPSELDSLISQNMQPVSSGNEEGFGRG